MNPGLCIMPAHGSKVVHHAGPWIQGCASCWLGVDYSMELQPGPQLQSCPALITRSNCNHTPWIHRGNCIEPRPHGSQLQPVSESITRWNWFQSLFLQKTRKLSDSDSDSNSMSAIIPQSFRKRSGTKAERLRMFPRFDRSKLTPNPG